MDWFVVFVVLAVIVGFLLLIDYLNGCPSSDVEKLRIRFNGEVLRGHCLVIDVRKEEQKRRNLEQGQLDGDVIVFMQGHGMTPKYGYNMTSLLAQKSRSGIVVIPHVYTPYGKDEAWRGDQGKLAILMEVVKRSLLMNSIELEESSSISDLPVRIESLGGGQLVSSPNNDSLHKNITAKVTVIGWSHGGLLARRFAHAYKQAVTGLGQLTPAGFDSWGRKPWAGLNLFVNFMIEVGLISLLIFRGHVKYPLIAGVAILKGAIGDSTHAMISLVRGSLVPGKLFRAYRDVEQCSFLLDDSNTPVDNLKNIVVLYGEKDTVFDPKKAVPEMDFQAQAQEASRALFERYYPNAIKSGVHCSFKVLPGNHIGPWIYVDQYVEEVLKGTDQLA